MTRRSSLASLFSLILLFLTTSPAFAAGRTTIEVLPRDGSYDRPLTVRVDLDGHGDVFNAAEATVALSPTLAIENITLGDCNFSFLKTPTPQNPSFAGVILAESSKKCTVYSLKLVPVAKGEGSVTITEAAVRRYGDAANVFSHAANGSYTLTAALKPPVAALSETPANGRYTVALSVVGANAAPVVGATVALNSVEGSDHEPRSTTDTSGTVTFQNLKAGVYDAVVTHQNERIGQAIINVAGPNRVIKLSIDVTNQRTNPLLKEASLLEAAAANPLLLGGILAAGIAAGGAITALVLKLRTKRKGA